MRAERRQELKTNDLSVVLEQTSTYIKDNISSILLFSILGVCLVGAVLYRSQTIAETQVQGWAAYYDAFEGLVPDPQNPNWAEEKIAEIERVITVFGDDEPLRDAARWQLSQFCLIQASDEDDQDAKQSLLNKAETLCQALVSSSKDRNLKASALNGLAAIEQSRYVIDGDLAHKETARSYLEQIRDGADYRGTPFQSDVLTHLNKFDDLWQELVMIEAPAPPVIEPAPSDDGQGDTEANAPASTEDTDAPSDQATENVTTTQPAAE